MAEIQKPPSGSEPSSTLVARFMRWTAHFGNEFYIALFVGWVGEFLFAYSTSTDSKECLRNFLILWFSGAGTFFIGCLVGFLFGFPKSRNGPNPSAREASGDTRLAARLTALQDNTNLEEVSDWLTKIVVGISLAEFRKIFSVIDWFAKEMDSAFAHNEGAYPVSIGILIYGFVCGFMAYYTWARTLFRRNVETETP